MNSHKIKIVFTVLMMLAMAACTSRDKDLREKRDNLIAIQVSRMENGQSGDAPPVFKVRLLPTKALKAIQPAAGNDHYWYKMDSAFYLKMGSQKVYPALVQAVAGGGQDTYEYILQFENSSSDKGKDSVDFIFEDKQLAQKAYALKLAY